MSAASWLQFVVFIAVLVATAVPLGRYMAKVYGDDERRPATGSSVRSSASSTASAASTRTREQRWTVYAYSLLGVQRRVVRWSCTPLQRLQGDLPFNPTDVPAVVPHLSFNTAVSFMTNTNWQSYGGEATMSHLTQMVGLAVQNFVSAAAGMATVAALIRGIVPSPAAHDRQLLGRPHAHDDPHPAAARRSSSRWCS